MVLRQRQYWGIGAGNTRDYEVDKRKLDEIISRVYEEYRENGVDGKNYLIDGGVVQLGCTQICLISETSQGLEALASKFGLPGFDPMKEK